MKDLTGCCQGIKVQPNMFSAINAQFPDHTDLEKLGEVEFNNEKYKILRPSIHKVRDHFKDVMMRRETSHLDKVLIDKNGFRHYWSTLDDAKARKSEGLPTHGDYAKDEEKSNFIEKQGKVTNSPKKRKRPREMTQEDVFKAIREQWTQDNKQALRNIDYIKDKNMILVETTMFCPFFGVMKTNHYLREDAFKTTKKPT